MSPIMKAVFGLVLAGAVLAPHATGAQTIVTKAGAADSAFERFLPALPADVPWLTAVRPTPAKEPVAALPDAGSLDALLLRVRTPEAPVPDLRPRSASASTPPVGM